MLARTMADLELTRTRSDRRLYSLEGVGTLRLHGLLSRSAIAEHGGQSWRFTTRGLLKRRVEASDAAGTVVGEFEPRSVRRGGIVRWGGQELALRPASSWRERYALAGGDRELALFDGKGWGRPVKVTVDEPGSIEPGLLLLAAFVVRGLAEDAGAAAAGASTAATSGGS